MSDVGGIASERLKAFIRRILNLQAEKKAIQEDIKEVYAEAKGTGFDTKTMRSVVTYIEKTEKDKDGLQEEEALLDLYKEALGIADLSEGKFDWGNHRPADRSRSTEKPKQRDLEEFAPTGQWKGRDDGEGEGDDSTPDPDKPATPPEPPPPPPTEEDARAMARQAAEEGKPVTANPFRARDPLRKAWDDEWCKATGQDGMEIPPEWRRKPKGKTDKTDDDKTKGTEP